MENVMGVGGVWVYPLWMDEMENVTGVGGIPVYPLLMDGIEKVVEWVAYGCNHCGWIGWERW